MAAIIAQLTRAKRERAQKKTYEPNKCMYELEPFDRHFEPSKHNKYLVRRADLVVRHQQLEMLECLVKKVNEEKKIASRVKFSYRRCFLESLVLVVMISIVPAVALVFDVIFSRAEQAINMS